jgi:hypothetical protein
MTRSAPVVDTTPAEFRRVTEVNYLGVVHGTLAARAALHAILHPRREMWIGWSTTKAIVGQPFSPAFWDRYLARKAWDAQTTTSLPATHPRKHDRDNVDAPIPGDRGAHGPFGSRSRRFSTRLWARTHRRWAAAAALVAAVIGVRRLARGGPALNQPKRASVKLGAAGLQARLDAPPPCPRATAWASIDVDAPPSKRRKKG